MTELAVAISDVRSAAERLTGVAQRTPVMTSRTFNAAVGAEVFFKCENLQRIGAFKFRGAYNALAQLTEQQRRRGVVAYSSGNHAQATALAAGLLDIPATIVMPADAPRVKVDATRGYGAKIVTYDRYTEDRREISAAIAEQAGAVTLPPYDHRQIIAGQGTAALELVEEVDGLDVVLAPLGGGGLMSGTAIAVRSVSPQTDLYGVEPEAGDDARQSLRAGSIVTIPQPRTLADGAATQFLGDLTFPILQAMLTDVLVAGDDELVEMMAFFASRMKIIVEPTGALAAAAVWNRRIDVSGKRVGVILSGGNVNLARFAELVHSAR